MRASATILAFLFVTGAAAAQETSETSKADYSKDSIMRVLRAQAEEDQKKANVSFHVGAVTFNAIGTRWRFNYLPIMAPLAGTRLTTSREWPDAFSLTGVPLATPKRAWRTQRQVDAEMKRITDTEKKKLKIRINAQ
ncbi:MAG TPA: hypothetical protein VF787_20680 [Thermoanaerobaculia bacterium]